MITDNEGAIEDDIDENELSHELYEEDGDDFELTRLSEMVRKQYLKYLEKQLYENLMNSSYSNKKNGIQKEDFDELYKISIKKTAELLENKAVRACMIAKFYQRAMVKIIAIVRRSTQENKLNHQLGKCIQAKEETSSKETQTEAVLLNSTCCTDQICKIPLVENDDGKPVMSLDEKIEMFEKHLQKEKSIEAVKKCSLNSINNEHIKFKKHYSCRKHLSNHKHYRHCDGKYSKLKKENFSPASSITVPTNSISPPTIKQQTFTDITSVQCTETKVVDDETTNDSVAIELARLFSEEKTELDEIFGIDPNEEPDDPQICKILKEIEEAKINHDNVCTEIPEISNIIVQKNIEISDTELYLNALEPKNIQQPCTDSSKLVDLSKSIWPCELFMQRRMLSESLTRLIEEDMRWHDIMKWKFIELFGEDSDDEFTPCSPSIELNEILISSCIRRISPWVVKHLMKPMKDGLIGNRFLFKKLAKHLARSIIMENQYPDETTIRNCVETFFCLHQAVMSLEDLDVDIPSISSM